MSGMLVAPVCVDGSEERGAVGGSIRCDDEEAEELGVGAISAREMAFDIFSMKLGSVMISSVVFEALTLRDPDVGGDLIHHLTIC